jgi:putative transposase
VIDMLMQLRRNAKAAKRFFEAALGQVASVPRVIVTDGLRSYNIISREVLTGVVHRCSKYLNNRAENSHQRTRRRERRMQRFKSSNQAQLFLSIFDIIYRYFHPPKHQLIAEVYCEQLDICCQNGTLWWDNLRHWLRFASPIHMHHTIT